MKDRLEVRGSNFEVEEVRGILLTTNRRSRTDRIRTLLVSVTDNLVVSHFAA